MVWERVPQLFSHRDFGKDSWANYGSGGGGDAVVLELGWGRGADGYGGSNSLEAGVGVAAADGRVVVCPSWGWNGILMMR